MTFPPRLKSFGTINVLTRVMHTYKMFRRTYKTKYEKIYKIESNFQMII